MANLNFTTQIFKEGKMYVSYCPELDVSSCGYSIDEARKNLKEAIEGFIESAQKRGILREILIEAGYSLEKDKEVWKEPELLLLEKSQVSLQYAYGHHIMKLHSIRRQKMANRSFFAQKNPQCTEAYICGFFEL